LLIKLKPIIRTCDFNWFIYSILISLKGRTQLASQDIVFVRVEKQNVDVTSSLLFF